MKIKLNCNIVYNGNYFSKGDVIDISKNTKHLKQYGVETTDKKTIDIKEVKETKNKQMTKTKTK